MFLLKLKHDGEYRTFAGLEPIRQTTRDGNLCIRAKGIVINSDLVGILTKNVLNCRDMGMQLAYADGNKLEGRFVPLFMSCYCGEYGDDMVDIEIESVGSVIHA